MYLDLYSAKDASWNLASYRFQINDSSAVFLDQTSLSYTLENTAVGGDESAIIYCRNAIESHHHYLFYNSARAEEIQLTAASIWAMFREENWSVLLNGRRLRNSEATMLNEAWEGRAGHSYDD